MGALILLGILPLLAAEALVRSLVDIPFLGNSKNLFANSRFGDIRGNAPNVSGVSFGEPVFTDENGFRIPAPGYEYPRAPSRSILIVGDSVAFGPGVHETNTFVGKLRQTQPRWAVLNAAVIGYSAADYRKVIGPLLEAWPEVSDVVLVYCLNDIASDSAQRIESVGWTETLRNFGLIAWANDWLRDHSKLYLVLKGAISDPGHRYFLADLQYYSRQSEVEKVIEDLHVVARTVRSRGRSFKVILAPYEFQLRPATTAVDSALPQRRISELLSRHGIAAIDAAAWFSSSIADGSSASRFFIRYDPMHFSREGHDVFFRGIASLLDSP